MIQSNPKHLTNFIKAFNEYGEKMFETKIMIQHCFQEIFQRSPSGNEMILFVADGKNIVNELEDVKMDKIYIPEQKCIRCQKDYYIENKPKSVVIYSSSGTQFGKRYTAKCKKCGIVDYGTFFSENGLRHLHYKETKYFLSTEDTAFETLFLKQYEWELVVACMPFRSKAAIYNGSNNYSKGNEETYHKKPRYIESYLLFSWNLQ